MLNIYDAQRQLIDKIEDQELASWIEGSNWVIGDRQKDLVLVYPRKCEVVLKAFRKRQIEVLRSVSRDTPLAETLQVKLELHNQVVFYPKLRLLRHFYNLAGFIHAMKPLEAKLPEAEIILPAGEYDGKVLFGVGRAAESKRV